VRLSNIFKEIPDSLKEELFEDIISTKYIKIERIVSDGHSSPKEGWYESEQNEWVIVLEGNATLALESGENIILKRGDYYNITAFSKHKVSHTSKNEKTIWLAIYY
jgi:cupin 2 domain-containing protein